MSLPTSTAGNLSTTELPKGRRFKAMLLLVMTVCILVPSLLGFVAKFYEFVQTFRGSEDGAFAITPILNYLLASIGFFCMLIWATVNGMFHDMERPKYHMLELENKLTQESAKPHSSR